MNKTWIALAALPLFVLAGCGSVANTPNPTTSPTSATQNATQNTTQNTTQNNADGNLAQNSTQNPSSSAAALKQQEVDLTVLPGGRLGPDGKMHDVITNANFTVVEGVPVKLTVYNYDAGEHSVTNGALNLNLQAKPSTKNGVPGVTTVTFTPTKTGDFNWQCVDMCDGQNGGWSMSHNGYMMGTIHVVPQSTNKQYVYLTIKDGLQYAAADGQLHDSYSPADFTVQAGIPVVMTVQNFDTGDHSFTSADLGVSNIFKGAAKSGEPTTSTFTFTPSKAGKFQWHCIIPCDGGPTGWAMSNAGYMSGSVTVTN